MKTIRFLPALVFGGVLMVVPLSASTIVIDGFNDFFGAETFYTAGGDAYTARGLEVGAMRLAPGITTVREFETQIQSGLSGVLGGERLASLTRTAPIGSSSFSRVGSADSGSFQWSHVNGPGTRSKALLQYDGGGSLNADFTTLGASGYFFLGGWNLDQGTVDARITLTSGFVTQSKSINLAAADALSPVDYTLSFADFNLISFDDIDVIKLEFITNSSAQDSGLRVFSARGVPVPDGAATALLVLVSIIGLFVSARTCLVRARS
jgi:hypothetical protein